MISIVMATYNGEKYINEQIDSILNQTYQDFELIICDDCSTDNTRKILTEYANKDSRIKLFFNEKNLGFKKNFEQSISHTKGDFIAFCDQDDYWYPNKLEISLSQIKKFDMICTNAEVTDSNLNSLGYTMHNRFNNYELPDNNIELLKKLIHRNFCQGTTILAKSDFIKQNLPIPDDVVYHDWYFAILAVLNNGIDYIKEPTLKYRQHGNNVTDNNLTTFSQNLLPVKYEYEKIYKKSFQSIYFCNLVREHFSEESFLNYLNETTEYYKALPEKKFYTIKYINKYYKYMNWDYTFIQKKIYVAKRFLGLIRFHLRRNPKQNIPVKSKIIYVKQEAIVEDYLFADLQFSKDSQIIIIKKTLLGKLLIGKNSPITKITKKLHLYNALSNSRLTSTLGKYIGRNTKNSVLILQAQILNFVGYKYLYKLSKKYNCKLCILTLDSVHASSPTFKSVLPIIQENKWDKIYTYDEYDAKEFGWTSINRAYFSTSKYPKINNRTTPEYDLYFTGGLKGNKDPLIFSSFKLFKESALNPLYALFCSDQKKFDEYSAQYKDIHFYNKWRNYDDIIHETMNSKCIVEILQENQKSQSIRYFEAILFNKKLLTNNPDIKKLPYYNPDYMQYFSSIDQIDIEWLKKDITVEYNYKNDFTPLKFIEQVKNDFPDLLYTE